MGADDSNIIVNDKFKEVINEEREDNVVLSIDNHDINTILSKFLVRIFLRYLWHKRIEQQCHIVKCNGCIRLVVAIFIMAVVVAMVVATYC